MAPSCPNCSPFPLRASTLGRESAKKIRRFWPQSPVQTPQALVSAQIRGQWQCIFPYGHFDRELQTCGCSKYAPVTTRTRLIAKTRPLLKTKWASNSLFGARRAVRNTCQRSRSFGHSHMGPSNNGPSTVLRPLDHRKRPSLGLSMSYDRSRGTRPRGVSPRDAPRAWWNPCFVSFSVGSVQGWVHRT